MASNYQLMLQERADRAADNRRILDAAEQANRDLTKDEDKQFKENMSRMQVLNTAIEIERSEREDRRHASSAGDQVRGRPAPTALYRDMFPAIAGNTRGFRTAKDFFSQVHSGLWSPELQAMMNSHEGAAGGFLVPEQFAAELLDGALEDEIVRPRARIEPMTSDSKTISGITHTSGAAGPYGGAVGGWTPEGGEIAVGDFPVRSIRLHAHGLKGLTQVSNEVLADARDMDNQLTIALRKTVSYLLDDAYLRGTGAGMPLGILNSPCTITVAKEVGQTADTFLYENAVKMLARLHAASFNKSVWVANPTLIPELMQLSIGVGTAGQVQPVMRESDGSFLLLTRPIVFSEKMSALGDEGDIILADFSQYAVGLREDVRIEKSMHTGFTRDTTYYRVVLRADGQPLWDAAYTPKHGDTQSPFVTLAARA